MYKVKLTRANGEESEFEASDDINILNITKNIGAELPYSWGMLYLCREG